MCEKRYNAVVLLALGWGCWKMYASKPEDKMHGEAMANLSICLVRAGHEAEADQVTSAIEQENNRLKAVRDRLQDLLKK